jgi:ribosomal protein S18 acetylase RimI-like enzyme
VSFVTDGPQISSLRTRFAGPADVDALVRLINAAFLVERPIFDGDRTNADLVRAFLEKGKFLIFEDSDGMAGCVYAELRGDRGYIGLLSVDPQRQGSGLGRKLMEAAEQFFREAGCVAADLRVVSARAPLPGFYRHLGYSETHREEIPPEVRPKVPCDFIYMSKQLAGRLESKD